MTFCGNVPVPDDPPEPVTSERRTCGNCGFATADSCYFVICNRDGRGFSNTPTPPQSYPASRGGCLYHFFARAS